MVAVSDTEGCIYNAKALDMQCEVLERHHGPVTPDASRLRREGHLPDPGHALQRGRRHGLRRAFDDVLKIHLDRKVNMRLAANILGVQRVADARRIRGLYP